MKNTETQAGQTVPCISLFGLLVCRRTSVWDGKPCDEAKAERERVSRTPEFSGSVSALKEQLIPLFETGDFRGICLSKGIDRDRQMRDCADIVIKTLELLEKKQNSKFYRSLPHNQN